jgi:transcriptional antiterminator NusG
MTGDKLTRAWYALHTKSRFENVVNEGLAKKTLDVFLPKITVKSRRRDRHKMIRVPLFPGYVFVRTDLNPYEHIEILKTTGAVKLIGSTRGPVPIADATDRFAEDHGLHGRRSDHRHAVSEKGTA